MTNRKKNIEFGIILSLVLVIISAYCQITSTIPVIIALAITLLAPGIYTPFTWCWFRLGDLFGLVVTHCILFLLFFGVITPIGILRRLMKKDPFHLRQFGKGSDSTFIKQEKKFYIQDLDKQY